MNIYSKNLHKNKDEEYNSIFEKDGNRREKKNQHDKLMIPSIWKYDVCGGSIGPTKYKVVCGSAIYKKSNPFYFTSNPI